MRSDEFETLSACDLRSARRIASDADLIVLDCQLPDGNGVDFCAELRKTSAVPVIFLTVLDSELDEVAAFRAGGCDYVKKPFSLMVLRERINSALTRSAVMSARGDSGDVYADARFRFDFSAMIFSADGDEVILSVTEQKLLRTLVSNARRIVPRAALTERLWPSGGDYIDENALSVTISRLRSKLGADTIRTAYGLGYMWEGGGI